ncbi:MAG: OsmC family protein [Candidatus Promineifilaceae bacterium]
MQARVVLQHGLTFTGSAESGHSVTMSVSRASGGDDDGPSPLELCLISMGGCTAIDVVAILRKKRQAVTGLEVRLATERAAEPPRVFTHFYLTFVVRGRGVDPGAVERAIELSQTKYCSVSAMLGLSGPIDCRYEIIEDEGGEAGDGRDPAGGASPRQGDITLP